MPLALRRERGEFLALEVGRRGPGARDGRAAPAVRRHARGGAADGRDGLQRGVDVQRDLGVRRALAAAATITAPVAAAPITATLTFTITATLTLTTTATLTFTIAAATITSIATAIKSGQIEPYYLRSRALVPPLCPPR